MTIFLEIIGLFILMLIAITNHIIIGILEELLKESEDK